MLLEIAQYGNPVLKEKCRPVEHFDDSLKTLAENMLETMYAAEGIGLAALDIGPIGQLLEPTGTLKFEETDAVFERMELLWIIYTILL